MKILIITPRVPYPPYRGDKLRLFHNAKTLAKRHRVDIVTFNQGKSDITSSLELKKFGINIKTVSLPFWVSFLKVIKNIFSGIPFQIAYYSSKKMQKELQEIVKENEYDIIYFHLIRSAQYFDAVEKSKALKILDCTDAISLYLERFSAITKNPIKKYALKLELHRIEQYERILNKFDTLFICSEKDKNYLEKKKIHPNIQLLSNGFDTELFKTDNTLFEKGRIIFTGNMPYFPNQDAASYFAKEIFPVVLVKYPSSKFFIVGQKPPLSLKKLVTKNIIVTGFVKDIKKEYNLSEINVAPIRFGAGTPNKVIEAIALGIPTIATSLSIAGLPEKLKKYILIADDPTSFVEKISYIFENPEIRNDMMKEAQEVIIDLLSMDKIIAEFESYLQKRFCKCVVQSSD